MKDDFKKILIDAQKQKKIVSIFLDIYNLSSCSVGLVNEVTDEYVRLNSISKNGELEGCEVRPLQEIFRIDFGGLYESKIELLHNNQGKIFKEYSLKSSDDQSLIIDTIKQAKSDKMIIELWTEDDGTSILGYVESIENNFTKISAVDEYGRDNGVVYIKTETVSSIDCGTMRCQKIKFLREHSRP